VFFFRWGRMYWCEAETAMDHSSARSSLLTVSGFYRLTTDGSAHGHIPATIAGLIFDCC
jgi:hypothetical protein